jgi:hypothetical protein
MTIKNGHHDIEWTRLRQSNAGGVTLWRPTHQQPRRYPLPSRFFCTMPLRRTHIAPKTVHALDGVIQRDALTHPAAAHYGLGGFNVLPGQLPSGGIRAKLGMNEVFTS